MRYIWFSKFLWHTQMALIIQLDKLCCTFGLDKKCSWYTELKIVTIKLQNHQLQKFRPKGTYVYAFKTIHTYIHYCAKI